MRSSTSIPTSSSWPIRCVAIARKDIPGAIRLTEELGGTYWLLGAAEEGYGPDLQRILGHARCRVIHGGATLERLVIYAAADAVAFPSTWEGFGNPPIEASFLRRPAAVGPYPVADELRALGFRWFPSDDSEPLRRFLAAPDHALLDHNEEVARRHFGQEQVEAALHRLLDAAGWLPR